MVGSDEFVVIHQLNIVLDGIGKLYRETFRRIKKQLEIVRAVLILSADAKPLLTLNGCEQLIARDADKGGVQQVRTVLVESLVHRFPGVEVVANDCSLGLWFKLPRTNRIGRFNADGWLIKREACDDRRERKCEE